MTEIEKRICICLFYVKLVLIALFTYLFFLTIAEGIFTLQNVNSKAVGYIKPTPKYKPKVMIQCYLNENLINL